MNIFDEDISFGSTADELPQGTELMLGQYQITRYLNSGGFGITYLAKDSLDRPVVIKECFPRSFCRRSDKLVEARSHENNGELRSIVRLFTHEARALSKLTHPFIVGVHQVFEDNNTAYMALDFVEGHDLMAVVEQKIMLLRPDQITAILQKTLDAIKCVHTGGLLHRDIAPDNIILTNELNPVLIDFGAAREQATKATRALSALRVVKDGYSPQEFYIAGSEQGPYSDLYSLAASFYHLITGELPPDSQVRIAAHVAGNPDPYIPLELKTSDYSPAFCSAIDKAMAILPKDRMQSADEWLAHLAQPQSVRRRSSRIKSKPKSTGRPSSKLQSADTKKQSAFSPKFGALIVGGALAAGAALAFPYVAPMLNSEDERTLADVSTPIATEQGSLGSAFETIAQVTPEPAREDLANSDPVKAAPAIDTTAEDITEEALIVLDVSTTESRTEPELIAPPVMEEPDPEVATTVETNLASLADAEPTVTEPTFDAVLQGFETSYANGLVAAEWKVDLPFEVDASGTVSAVSAIAPNWLQVGIRITEVAGATVNDRDGFYNAVRSEAIKGNGEQASIAFVASHDGNGDPIFGQVDAQIIYSAQVADGYSFATSMQGSDWLTTVVEVPYEANEQTPNLRPGDVIVAVMGTDEALNDGSAVARIFGGKIEAGQSTVQFAVNRDGLMWIIDLDTGA